MSTVLIAGGATGIGRATALQLRGQGHDVHIADIDEAAALEVVAGSQDQAGAGSARFCDLSRPDAPAQAVRDALDLNGSLDAVVFCAALLVETALDEFKLEDWDRTMALNLRAPFLLVQAAAAELRRSPAGRVVLIGSTAAFRGGAGSFAYAASKGGVVAMTRSLAVALAPDGVCVNCVCPGWIDTAFNDPYWSRVGATEGALRSLESRIPLGAQGMPADVGAVISFLVSPESRYVTGQSIVVDGGLLAS
jgi:NAD(P)-dependent dehydrogenase (short-subunit alcohol dehydrogenase family)